MGMLLKLFSRPDPVLLRLPSGSFAVGSDGRVLVGTLPSSFPADLVEEIATHIMAILHDAQDAQLPLSDLVLNYPSLKITARSLRGGAIVFLSPKDPAARAKLN